MKKMMIIAMSAVLALGFFAGSILSVNGGTAGKKILVLGFRSSAINDVQDRLLRESVMRELLKRKYAIVPVMELENVITEDGINLRKISPERARKLAQRFEADYALMGSISLRARRYHTTLRILGPLLKKNLPCEIISEQGLSFPEYMDALSREIADRIDLACNKPGR